MSCSVAALTSARNGTSSGSVGAPSQFGRVELGRKGFCRSTEIRVQQDTVMGRLFSEQWVGVLSQH